MYDGATVVPTYSDLIFRLVKTFFTATVPSNWQVYSPDRGGDLGPVVPAGADPHLQEGRHAGAAADARRLLPELLR